MGVSSITAAHTITRGRLKHRNCEGFSNSLLSRRRAVLRTPEREQQQGHSESACYFWRQPFFLAELRQTRSQTDFTCVRELAHILVMILHKSGTLFLR